MCITPIIFRHKILRDDSSNLTDTDLMQVSSTEVLDPAHTGWYLFDRHTPTYVTAANRFIPAVILL